MKKKKAKIIIISITTILLVVILGFVIGGYILFKNEINAVRTFETLDNGFYTFEYKGDYGFEKLLANGGVTSDEELAGFLSEFLSKGFYKYEPESGAYACSTISATSADGDKVFGRNFDWENCKSVIVRTAPKNGYRSLSTVNLDFLGFGENFAPDSIPNKMMALAAIYVPLDGINEKGLCVADLIIRVDERTHQDTDKCDLTTTTAIRLLLDKAANVDEAIELLQQYDMNSSADMMHHLSVSDASGRSVVIEYVDNQMIITDTTVVTNFYISEKAPDRSMNENNVGRYNTLMDIYNSHNGILDENGIKNALIAVEDDTEWSIVYNKTKLTLTLYRQANFDKGYTYSL